jgi:autoinducer 2-degrading protein
MIEKNVARHLRPYAELTKKHADKRKFKPLRGFFGVKCPATGNNAIFGPLLIFILMTVTFVHVQVKPEFIESFIEATRENHKQSVKEPGNFRFDILQDAMDRGTFILYEAYEHEEAVAAHKETAHYRKWRDSVASWMAKPREAVKYTLLCPAAAKPVS